MKKVVASFDVVRFGRRNARNELKLTIKVCGHFQPAFPLISALPHTMDGSKQRETEKASSQLPLFHLFLSLCLQVK